MYKYFISFTLLCCLTIATINGQEHVAKSDSLKKIQFNGGRIDIDMAPLTTFFSNKNETFNYEIAGQFNLNNTYYPVVEIGYAGANKTTGSNIVYQGKALFYRIGIDFNLLTAKKGNQQPSKNLFLVGGRLGYTHYQYDLLRISLEDNYWHSNITYNLNNIPATNFWYEIAAGIRVEVFHNIYLGWTVRIKNMLTQIKSGNYKPWHVPGYGVWGNGSVWGFNYLIGYKF